MLAKDSGVLVFDAETTGTDRRRDQVIELCVQHGLEVEAETRTWRIRPEVPISPGAQAVHGISMEDLESCPRFADVAGEIRAIFDGVDVLVGYNLSFDIDMLQEEYRRLGQPPPDLAQKKIVDAYRLWQQCEPRSLVDAHRRFVGEDFDAAHSATADVAATGRVLGRMLERFELDRDWNALAEMCEPERALWLGPSRHVLWNQDGFPAVNFGKHKGTDLHELASGPDRDYLSWIADKDFPPHVRELCQQALALPRAEFLAWVRETFAAGERAGAENGSAASSVGADRAHQSCEKPEQLELTL